MILYDDLSCDDDVFFLAVRGWITLSFTDQLCLCERQINPTTSKPSREHSRVPKGVLAKNIILLYLVCN